MAANKLGKQSLLSRVGLVMEVVMPQDGVVHWINVRDPLYTGVWESLYLCKADPFFLPRVMWAKYRCLCHS